ncbi:hypothetical protein [Corynebacterium kutscheri]|nr:hypothetical protein [Corynebacterium kutscheri]
MSNINTFKDQSTRTTASNSTLYLPKLIDAYRTQPVPPLILG